MADNPLFSDDMWEIVESFIVETREILDELDNDLLQLEQAYQDKALVDKIFRAVHTVKGTSGFLSLEQLSVLAHHFEDVLNRLRKGELDFHPGMMDVMFAAFDQMKVLLEQVVEQRIAPIDLEAVIADLEAISDGTFVADEASAQPLASAPVAPEPVAPGAADPAAEAPVAKDPAAETQEAALAGADVEPVAALEPVAVEPPLEAPEAEASRPTRTDPVTPDEDDDAPAAGASRRTHRATETIRVEVDRLDNLMNLVGELVLGRNRLLQIVSDLDSARAEEAAAELQRELGDTSAQVDFITTELQAAVMHTRMVQIGRVFGKLPRMVRDLAKEFGKGIHIEIEGEETELDKSLVEEIGDPLVHLIRNAADHGIESPEARRAKGKPETGTIRLTAAHEGNNIVITIEDDGAGLNPAKLAAKAIEKGLITEKEAAEMGTAEIYNLIFRPGFSTAQTVSQVSGRGVGMDVVKTNITKLNGTITIDSDIDRGTRFTLKLPLTLAIIQSLLVRVAEDTFAVPLHAVVEVVAIRPEDVSTIRGREVIRLREQVLPLLHVGEALGLDVPRRERAYAVIMAVAHHRLGFVVDDLVGQKEIVIKPLGDFLKKIAGIAGSTILGDGRVIMILDVPELLRLQNDRLKQRAGG